MGANRRRFLRTLGQGALGAAALPLVPGLHRAEVPWPPPAGVEEDDFWAFVRAQYPLTGERTYLNTGGLGPAPYPVLGAARRTTMRLQATCETGHELFEAMHEPVARFFGVEPAEIAFTRNATEGNSIVAAGLPLSAGDEVIFESHAHPGGFLPWLNRQKLGGIDVKLFEPDPHSAEGNLQRIEDLITPRTRVVQVSHVTAPTGIRFPAHAIACLAREHDCWFHIDGAQSAGMFPVDLYETGCDSYATSGHKWMGAPHGTGLVFVREERLDMVRPIHVGSYSQECYELPDLYTYHPTAQRYEYGTRSAAQAVGVAAAVEFMEQIGMEKVEQRGRQLAERLRTQLQHIDGVTILTPSDPALSGSILTFKTDQVPYDDLYRFFVTQRRLRCRIVTERGLDAIRVSPHIYSSTADCDLVAEATRAAIEEAR